MDKDVRACRVQQVSDRIYRNHLKTRFCNLQEQHKLQNTIVALEKLERDAWVEMDHRRKELEARFKRISQAKTSYKSYTSEYDKQYYGKFQKKRSLDRHSGPKRTFTCLSRKPSFTSLLRPYQTDDVEYRDVLGYAQHLTKKKTRKSSTVHTDIQFEDLRSYSTRTNKMSKSQRMILSGLRKSAKELIAMGMIKPPKSRNKELVNMGIISSSRKISILAPPILEDENARYLRVPISPSTIEEEEEEEGSTSPIVPTSPIHLSVDQICTRENVSDIIRAKRRNSDRGRAGILPPLPRRRGSRSLCEAEMRGCTPPYPGSEISDKLHVFNSKMSRSSLKEHHGYLYTRAILEDSHRAPPPRDDVILPNKEVPKISSINRFELAKWRQDMALTDTIPAIRKCKYIRDPYKERLERESNQDYNIEVESVGRGPETEDPEHTTANLYEVVQQLLKAKLQGDGPKE